MRVWRVSSRRFVDTAFSGIGASLYPGRWNHRGVHMVYTASSRSLARLEILVHTDQDLAPPDLVIMAADIPDDTIATLALDELPESWHMIPAGSWTRDRGTEWFHAEQSLALRVPSVVESQEFNILVNPRHADFAQVQIKPPQTLIWDPRLFAPTTAASTSDTED